MSTLPASSAWHEPGGTRTPAAASLQGHIRHLDLCQVRAASRGGRGNNWRAGPEPSEMRNEHLVDAARAITSTPRVLGRQQGDGGPRHTSRNPVECRFGQKIADRNRLGTLGLLRTWKAEIQYRITDT